MFRPAKEVWGDVEAERHEQREKNNDLLRKEIANKIQTNKRQGQTVVRDIPKEVMQELKDCGYKVTYHPPAHGGDVDSYTIKWKP